MEGTKLTGGGKEGRRRADLTSSVLWTELWAAHPIAGMGQNQDSIPVWLHTPAFPTRPHGSVAACRPWVPALQPSCPGAHWAVGPSTMVFPLPVSSVLESGWVESVFPARWVPCRGGVCAGRAALSSFHHGLPSILKEVACHGALSPHPPLSFLCWQSSCPIRSSSESSSVIALVLVCNPGLVRFSAHCSVERQASGRQRPRLFAPHCIFLVSHSSWPLEGL